MMQQLANFIVDHDPMMVYGAHTTRCATFGGSGTRNMPTPLMKKNFACSSVMNTTVI